MDGWYLLIDDLLFQIERVDATDSPRRSRTEQQALAAKIAAQVEHSLMEFYSQVWQE